MIIPKSNKKSKIVTAKHDIDVGYAIITTGHMFKIIGEDIDGLIIQEYEYEHDINKFYSTFRGIDINDLNYHDGILQSKSEYNYHWDALERKIQHYCPYFDTEYHEYSNVSNNICMFNKKRYDYDKCVVKSTCLKYLSEESIKEIRKDEKLSLFIDKIKNNIRKHKLKKLL